MAGELGIPTAYGSYEELLADPSIEAIYNPLPNHLHVPWTMRALEAGKHVLCEKPIALTAEEAKQLIAVRERTGKLVAEAFMVRQNPQWSPRARSPGPARSAKCGRSRRFLPITCSTRPMCATGRLGGGGLMDIGCYAIVTARYIFGAEPTRVARAIDATR